MLAAFLLIGAAAALPTAAEVRDAAYVGAIGGLCGDRPCARDPNIAEVRDVACYSGERGEAICNYLFRVGNRGAFEAVSDTLYRDLSNNNWYLDDNDDDDAIQPTSSKIRR